MNNKGINNNEVLFKYGDIEMAAVIVDGEPFLPAKEVCGMLDIKNVSMAVKRIDPEERRLINVATAGGIQKTTHLTESGLYELIFSSRKPEARKFKRWVFKEVLPKIRRTGVYNLIEEQEQTIFGKAMIRTIYGIEADVLEHKE